MARKILLADDSVTAQNMGRKILADAGYEVTAVNNGSAALKKVTEIKPDLVVLDVYMPGYSGLEVCQRMKESPETGRIPVLLTVGKLEPFKPEEAQRVRADAFIVKPFEASELLKALEKLEDKVVPRSEGSKPGRFARAIAAVEEIGRTGRGDDNGWKSRISFPHKKTDEEEKEEKKLQEQPSTYNPVNRDLRTVVEAPAVKAEEKKQESAGRGAETVDVQALAPTGLSAPALPAGVTQEELAAITAAAAQIQQLSATIAEEKRANEAPNEPVPAVGIETVGFEPPMREIELSTAPAASEVKTPAEEIPAAKSERKETEARETESRDVPVTMAATAESVAGSSSGAPRWTAVAVALEGEEARISLEQEMQLAFAATQSVASNPASQQENAPVETQATSAMFTSAAVVTPEAPMSAAAAHTTAPEVEPEPKAMPAASVPEFAVSAEEKTETKQDFSEARPEKEVREEIPQPLYQSEATMAAPVAAAPLAATQAASSPYEAESMTPTAPTSTPYEPIADASGWTQLRESNVQTAADGQAQPSKSESASLSAEAASAAVSSTPELSPSGRTTPAEFASSVGSFIANEPSAESSSNESSSKGNLDSGSQPQPESDAVKSTAAAWASWRHVRDRKTEETGAAEPSPVEANAAAVAAGAERAMQANTEQEEHPADVASIVDSVLADLRPKLMKEISRKIAEKK